MAAISLNYIANRFWQRDPGFFRLKHASKTILAIILSVLLFSQSSLLMMVYAGMAAGFSIQGHVGVTRWQRAQSIIIADIAFIISFFLGSLSQGHLIYTSLLLIVLAFLVMYVRRFGQRFMVFPLFIWVFAFLGTILPGGPIPVIVQHSLAMLCGCIIAALVYLYVFSLDKLSVFYSTLAKAFSSFAVLLNWFNQVLDSKQLSAEQLQQMQEYRTHIVALLSLNQSLIEQTSGMSVATNNRVMRLLVRQSAMTKALSIVVEGMQAFYAQGAELSPVKRQHLRQMLHYYADILQHISVDTGKGIIQVPNMQLSDQLLSDFKKYLADCQLDQQYQLVSVLNVYLGLRLLARNLGYL